MTSNAPDMADRRRRVDGTAVFWVMAISAVTALTAVPPIERAFRGLTGWRPHSTTSLLIGSWNAPTGIVVEGGTSGAIMLVPQRRGKPSGVMIAGSTVTFYDAHPSSGRHGPPAVNMGASSSRAFLQLFNPAAPESPWAVPRRRDDDPSPESQRQREEEISDES